MLILSIVFIAGFLFGIFCYWLFNKKIKITISSRESENCNKTITLNTAKYSPKTNNLPKSDKFYKASCLIEEIKTNGTLPIKISPAVLHSLTIISKTPNWEQQLDDESLDNLNRIYERWQRYVRGSNKEILHMEVAGNMEQPKYWEGTEEEYFKALEEGVIDEDTKVNIIIDEKNYRGSWITRNPDGSVEEYME